MLLLLKPSNLVQEAGQHSSLNEFMEPVLSRCRRGRYSASYNSVAVPAVAESVRHLADIDMGIITLHGKLLVAACATCASAAELVFQGYLGPALTQYMAVSRLCKRASCWTESSDVDNADNAVGGRGATAACYC
jgi:hypothetical protein